MTPVRLEPAALCQNEINYYIISKRAATKHSTCTTELHVCPFVSLYIQKDFDPLVPVGHVFSTWLMRFNLHVYAKLG